MDCKHLCDCIKIEKEAVKNKKSELTPQASSPAAAPAVATAANNQKGCWKCLGELDDSAQALPICGTGTCFQHSWLWGHFQVFLRHEKVCKSVKINMYITVFDCIGVRWFFLNTATHTYCVDGRIKPI